MRFLHFKPALAVLFAAGLASPAPQARAGEAIVFNRDIRPILAENCFYCHGPDPGTRKASLRLDREEGFFGPRDEGPVVIKGKPEESPLYKRLVSKDSDEVMPPPKAHHELKPAQIDLLQGWIAKGRPGSRTGPSSSRSGRRCRRCRAGWARNADRPLYPGPPRIRRASPRPRRRTAARWPAAFRSISPACRRSPCWWSAFVADPAPDAYEKLVDLLMSSPRYGEHRARYWLDAARYARHARHALRQLPRDLALPRLGHQRVQRQQAVRPVHHRAARGRPAAESYASRSSSPPASSAATSPPAKAAPSPEENLANYARDRVETTSWVCLGLTTNCAVCHDHKFDPITHEGLLLDGRLFPKHHAGRQGRQREGPAAGARAARRRGPPALGGYATEIAAGHRARWPSAKKALARGIATGMAGATARDRRRRGSPALRSRAAERRRRAGSRPANGQAPRRPWPRRRDLEAGREARPGAW